MGVYAAQIVRDEIGEACGRRGQVFAAPLVVSNEGISDAALRVFFPESKKVFLLVAGGGENEDDYGYADGREESSVIVRLRWDGEASRIASHFSGEGPQNVGIFLQPFAPSSGRQMWSLSRQFGIRELYFLEGRKESSVGVRWRRMSVGCALIGKLAGRLMRSKVSELRIPVELYEWIRAKQAAGETRLKGVGERKVIKVHHYISNLDSGGAERQLTLLASALAKYEFEDSAPFEQKVRTAVGLSGSGGHFVPELQRVGVEVRQAGLRDELNGMFAAKMATLCGKSGLFNRLSIEMRGAVYDLIGELIAGRPDLLHSWLDMPNIVAGLAGLAAGVGRIVLSLRNVNPSHFPGLHQPWMREIYQLLAERSEVSFICNSNAGASDYADWIGVDANRLTVIPNAVKKPSNESIASDQGRQRVRAELEIDEMTPMVLGVFRLAEEKEPTTWIRVLAEARKRVSNLQGVIVGVGPLLGEVRRQIRQYGLEGVIHLLGSRRDVYTLMRSGDVHLLTSREEGCPNCVLEAMACGLPVVATGTRGTSEIVQNGETGLLAEVGDVGALARAVVQMIRDDELRRCLSKRASEVVAERYSIDELVRRTIEVYGIKSGGCVVQRAGACQEK